MTTQRHHEPCLDEETLAAMADGSLSGPARDAAEVHLAGCATCRAEVVALVRLTAEGASPSSVPAGLADRVRARIPVAAASSLAAARGSRPREASMSRILGSFAALAAAVLVGVGLSQISSPRGATPTRPGGVGDPNAPMGGYTADGRPCRSPDGTYSTRSAVATAAIPPAVPAIVGDVLAPPRPADLGGNERYLAHVSTDKPTYRPGERVMARAVLLDAFRRSPFARRTPVGFVVRSARGAEVARVKSVAISGVAEFGWEIPADAAGGTYTLVADAAWLGIPTGEITFDVRDYRVPRMRTDLQFVRKAYGPGDEVAATLEATRAEGGIPAGATVTAVARVDGQEVFRKDGLSIDTLGRCAVSFVLPKEIAVGEGTLALVIRDGGVQETAAKTIPIVVNRVAITFAPEGGDLIGGVYGRVYFEARTPKQEPADVEGRVLDGAGRVATRFSSVHEGRGSFWFTPQAGDAYRVVLDKPAGISSPFPLPAVATTGFVLAAQADRFGASEPVGVWIASPVETAATVVLYQHERELSMSAVRLSARMPAEINLPAADASGVLRVTVYDAKGVPRAERLVFRRPATAVHVEMAVGSDGTVPGGKVTVAVRTTDDLGRPVPAIVGIAATDDALLSTIDPRERAPRLSVQALLGAEVRELRDARLYLGDDAESARRTDLLLGTQGWRRFGFVKLDEFEKADGDRATRALARRTIWSWRESSLDLTMAETVNDEDHPFFGGEEFKDLDAMKRPLAADGPAMPGRGIPRANRPLDGAVPPGLREPADPRPPPKPVDATPPLYDAPVDGVREFAPDAPPPLVPAPPLPLPPAKPAMPPSGVIVPVEPLPQAVADGAAAMDEGEAGRAVGVGGGGGSGGGARLLEASRIRLARSTITSWSTFMPGPVWARVFAHTVVADRPADARRDFTETVYWNAGLVTGADGRAQFTFDASDAVTTVRVRADAFTADGALGEADATVEVRRPFYAEPKFPLEVTAGDRIELPIALSNGTANALAAKVTIAVADGLSLRAGSKSEMPVDLPARSSARVVVSLDVGTTPGQATIHLIAEAGAWKDDVVREIRVVPAGFPVAQEFGGVLERTVEHELDIPADVAPGSVETQATVFPTPLASLTEALAALLQEPCGCFEQTSSSNYPNVMALRYLQTHRGVDPALVKRAADLAARGYQRLVSYETKERGYEWFGANPGHEALTAYGVMEFTDMAGVTAVDADMLARTRAWLLARRDGKGGFSRNDRALDSFGRAPEDVTNAYIVWALVEAGEKGIDRELARLKDVALATKDPYVLALAANVFGKLGDDVVGSLRDRLAKMQSKDGVVSGAATSITGSGGESLDIETTSLAILAWLPSPTHVKNVEAAMTWLAARCKSGRFGSTQGTILALKAILAYDARHARPATAGSVTALVDGEAAASVAFAADAQGAIVVPNFAGKLTAGHHRITLKIDGGADMPYALTVRYHAATPPSSPQTAVDVATSIGKTDVAEGEPVEVPVTITNRTDKGIPMVVAIVGLPGGVEARPEALKALVKDGSVDAFETRGREVILYWRGFAPSASHALTIPCVAAVPGTYTGPASRAYLYYTDEHKRWTPGLGITIRAK
jgi:alpha-2-macroglobulin-like protein